MFLMLIACFVLPGMVSDRWLVVQPRMLNSPLARSVTALAQPLFQSEQTTCILAWFASGICVVLRACVSS